MFTENGEWRGAICTGRCTVSPNNSRTDICITHFYSQQILLAICHTCRPIYFARQTENIFPHVRKSVKAYRGRRRVAPVFLHFGHHRTFQLVTCLEFFGVKYLLLSFQYFSQGRYRHNVLNWLTAAWFTSFVFRYLLITEFYDNVSSLKGRKTTNNVLQWHLTLANREEAPPYSSAPLPISFQCNLDSGHDHFLPVFVHPSCVKPSLYIQLLTLYIPLVSTCSKFININWSIFSYTLFISSVNIAQ